MSLSIYAMSILRYPFHRSVRTVKRLQTLILAITPVKHTQLGLDSLTGLVREHLTARLCLVLAMLVRLARALRRGEDKGLQQRHLTPVYLLGIKLVILPDLRNAIIHSDTAQHGDIEDIGRQTAQIVYYVEFNAHGVMSENGLWVQEPPPAPDGLRRCLRCVNDDVLSELNEGWHSGEEYLCVPLVIHAARNNSVHYSAQAVGDWGEGALHAVVEE